MSHLLELMAWVAEVVRPRYQRFLDFLPDVPLYICCCLFAALIIQVACEVLS